MTTEGDATGTGPVIAYIRQTVPVTTLYLAGLFFAAGDAAWPAGWVFAGLTVAYLVANPVALRRWNPSLLAERGQVLRKETKPFDRVFVFLYLPITALIYVAMGLDHRFGWSAMPLWLIFVGVGLFVLSCPVGLWAMCVNPHFEFTAVIRADGSQRVVSSGPYRWVRHPGYLAALISAASFPLILGSWVGLAATALFFALFITRTALEDSALRRELPGYGDYAATTKARLLPGVW